MNPQDNGLIGFSHIACLGPEDYPTEKVPVKIIGPAQAPRFMRCLTADGRELTVHENKLKAVVA